MLERSFKFLVVHGPGFLLTWLRPKAQLARPEPTEASWLPPCFSACVLGKSVAFASYGQVRGGVGLTDRQIGRQESRQTDRQRKKEERGRKGRQRKERMRKGWKHR